MLTTVLIFAAITAMLEAFLLLKYASLQRLTSKRFAAGVHIGVSMLNLIVHWGTIVGTMTAITAALVSFAVYPAVIWLKVFWTENHRGQESLG